MKTLDEQQILTLEGRELDAALAEASGWKRYFFRKEKEAHGINGCERLYWLDDPDRRLGPVGPGVVECPDAEARYTNGLEYVPLFHTDLNAIHEVEQKVIEEVGALDFVRNLNEVCGFPCLSYPDSVDMIPLIRATATQRARACLLALQRGKD